VPAGGDAETTTQALDPPSSQDNQRQSHDARLAAAGRLALPIEHTDITGSDAGVPFTYAEIRLHAVAESPDEPGLVQSAARCLTCEKALSSLSIYRNVACAHRT
jgi:hypothetical protein